MATVLFTFGNHKTIELNGYAPDIIEFIIKYELPIYNIVNLNSSPELILEIKNLSNDQLVKLLLDYLFNDTRSTTETIFSTYSIGGFALVCKELLKLKQRELDNLLKPSNGSLLRHKLLTIENILDEFVSRLTLEIE